MSRGLNESCLRTGAVNGDSLLFPKVYMKYHYLHPGGAPGDGSKMHDLCTKCYVI